MDIDQRLRSMTAASEQSGRRAFLKGAVTAAGILGTGLGVSMAHADALTRKQRDKMTPDDIISAMKRGNERFRNGERKARSFLNE